MSINSQNSRTSRLLSILLIYVIFANELIPFSRAMHSIEWQKVNSLKTDYYLHDSFSQMSQQKTKSDSKMDHFDSDQKVTTAITNRSSNSLKVAGGPGQSEITGSTANVGGDLVDKFTGNMAYSLPVMDVEGFPITISYDPNISMDQEASWVGLGWNLALGSINREMRGIPDDFNGDKIERQFKSEENTVSGTTNGFNVFRGYGSPLFLDYTGPLSDEVSGGVFSITRSLSFSFGKYLNNYTGEGRTMSIGTGISASLLGFGFNRSVGLSLDNQNGLGFNKSFGFQAIPTVGIFEGGYHWQKSTSLNSRSGVKNTSTSSGWQLGAYIGCFNFSTGATRGSMRTFGVQTFVPRFANPTIGSSTSDAFGYNGTFIKQGIKYVGGGYQTSDFSKSNSNVTNSNIYPAFGYNHYSKGKNNSKAMLDFNRGALTNASSEMRLLSFSAPTHDLYYCSAPGLSASYRAYRYDVVEYHDPTVISSEESEEFANELNISGGTNIQGNITAGVGLTESETDGTNGSSTSGALNNYFPGISANSTFDREEYVLKTQGEVKPVDGNLLNSYQGKNASLLDIQLLTANSEVVPTGNLVSGSVSGTPLALPSQNSDLNRTNNSIHYREMKIGEMTPPVVYEEVLWENDCPRVALEHENFFTDAKLAHHTGSVEVVDESGMRYVFGIPTYSYSQNEVSFSASGLYNEINYNQTGMTRYSPGDDSFNNSRGRHEMFEKTITPAFSTSFLLSEMLSADYIDRTGNGPTVDDQGNYYKLNYTNPYDQNDPYIWRMPICSDEDNPEFEKSSRLAYLNRNYHSDNWDDVASYMYGEKDLWYAVSIESKNLIAYFCLEDREDQFSMKGKDGGLDLDKPGKLLRKIMLFSKNDMDVNHCENAVPIQVVEFEYDYSLCKNYVGNKNTNNCNTSESGKLTLKAIYVYAGNSKEGKGLPIEFDYDEDNPAMNPCFAFNSTDRWGVYKPNNPNLPNHEFPYADQSAQAQTSIQAWKLKTVSITGGTKTDFTYERDNYGFVQNKRAMRMFQVAGMSNITILQSVNNSDVIINQGDLTANNIQSSFRNPSEVHDYYNVMYFKLDEPINSALNENEVLKNLYFKDANGNVPDIFYFNMYSKLGNRESDRFEFVESSVKIGKQLNNGNYAGVAGLPDGSGNFHYGWVIIQPEDISQYGDEPTVKFINAYLEIISQMLPFSIGPLFVQKVNPLIIANWQYARLNVPCTVYGEIDYSAGTPQDYCDYSIENDVNIFGANIYKRFNKKDYGLYFDPNKSMVRLFEPDNVKLGGDCRISAVTVHDNWDQYSGEYNTSYTYNYSYQSDAGNSSGVASYEPQVGSNENPLYQLVAYEYPMLLLPNEVAYQKDPWGDLVYPSPNVGYSNVQSGLFNGSVVGSAVDEFYTLKDFPTIAKRTEIKRIKAAGESALEEDGFVSELYGFSQGFYVETSDYHGKPKRSQVYGKMGELISSSEVEYYNHNSEKINFLNPTGTVLETDTPRDIDIYADSWFSESTFFSFTNSTANTIGFTLMGSVPVPILRHEEDFNVTQYYTGAKAFTFNKVLHHYVVAKSIKTNYLGSNNTARNVYFDPNSGAVIVSSLKDEFNDELTSMSYPANWYYDNFRNMSFSDGAVFNSSEISGTNNIIQINSTHGIVLNEGDKLLIKTPSVTVYAWVLEKQGSDIYLIDASGAAISGINWSNVTITIERTGVKNNLGAEMMSVTTKKFPLQTSGTPFVYPSMDIISSSAAEFGENKNIACIPLHVVGTSEEANYTSPAQFKPDDIVNPYLKGTKGNFRGLSGFAFQEGRESNDLNGIRQNGTLTNYEPFYRLNSGQWYAINESGHPDNLTPGDYNKWRKLGKMDQFDEFGKPLQMTDQINVSSATIYGMNNDLKLVQKATASNARSHEIGFDGFEDHHYFGGGGLGYQDFGFSLKPQNILDVVSDKRHSGKYSLRVESEANYDFDVYTPVTTVANVEDGEYFVRECDCIQGFAPEAGKKYLLSTWVHEDTKVYPFVNSQVVVTVLDQGGANLATYQFSPTGAVIDGWQKIEGEYEIPAGGYSINISLINNSSTTATYFDDFRTHPLLAGMTTTVYNQNNLLPIAVHDGYNYTTFYNYDENFQLVRVRVETIEGIKTISEEETGSFRKEQ